MQTDFDGKLVVTLIPSWLKISCVTGNVPIIPPVVVMRSIKMGDVTPKEASGISLLKTSGKLPSATEAALFGRRPGKGTVPVVPV